MLLLFLNNLIFSLLLSGCAAKESHAPEGETVTFTDALGRSVSVRKGVTRAAALIGSFADVWQLAGGTLCASADDAWDELGLDMGVLRLTKNRARPPTGVGAVSFFGWRESVKPAPGS